MCMDGCWISSKQPTPLFAVKYLQIGGGVAPNGHSCQVGWTACWESDT